MGIKLTRHLALPPELLVRRYRITDPYPPAPVYLQTISANRRKNETGKLKPAI